MDARSVYPSVLIFLSFLSFPAVRIDTCLSDVCSRDVLLFYNVL